MMTAEQCPWIKYLTIDEETLESKLRPDTPKHIQDAYNAYMLEIEEYKKSSKKIPK